MPSDVAAAGPGRGDGDARLDGDLVGVRADADLDGLAGVRQADLDPLPADHDGSADGDAAGDGKGFGQAGRLGDAGPGSAQQRRNVDLEVRWFDPYTHDVATTGRSGNVTHILDGRPVPYVARPYKTILLNDDRWRHYPGNLVALSQLFDLSSSAMKGTLGMLAQSSELVKEVVIHDTQIDWVLDMHGRTVRSAGGKGLPSHIEGLILLELAGVHARHHARVEPTFLILDGLVDFYHSSTQIASLER